MTPPASPLAKPPQPLTPTSMGTIAGTDKPLPCIPREAILRGDWDDGSLVRSFLAELERKER